MAPISRKSRRGAQQVQGRDRMRSRWSDSTTSGSGSGTSSRGSSKDVPGTPPNMQLEAARALVVDLVNLPSPTRPQWGETEAPQNRMFSNGRSSYREQLRATGNQALQRVKEGNKAPMMQRMNTPETTTRKPLPLSSPPMSPISTMSTMNPMTPMSPMSPISAPMTPMEMRVPSDGTAPASPHGHAQPAPYVVPVMGPPGPMMGWHEYAPAGYWQGMPMGSPMMEMARAPELPIDFLTMTLMQAGAFGVDKEQLAAQLRAAADVLYED